MVIEQRKLSSDEYINNFRKHSLMSSNKTKKIIYRNKTYYALKIRYYFKSQKPDN